MRINYLVTPGVVLGAMLGTANAWAASPNIVEQWNKIAEDTVVASGAFQAEGELYMAYVSAAVYDAVVAINGRYKQLATPVTAPPGASTDAAVIEAAYDTLVNYFPANTATLNPLYTAALAGIPDGTAKTNGQAVGLAAAAAVIALRTGDGRLTPIATTSPFLARTPGPGVYRLTPPAYARPQTPWVGSMKPWGLQSADQFLPEPPPDLSSDTWANAFAYIQAFGAANSTVRTAEQTAIAQFYTANAPRQFNRIARDFADAHGLDVVQTARLAAMINVVLADAGIAFFQAKYHYLFWRPVTAIDPTSVKPAGDGFGPVPGYDDGNPNTIEHPGWRPLLATPNHPEYPSAHVTFTSAVAETLSRWLGTKNINIDVHGFDAAGPPGNLNAVHHFATVADELEEVSNARIWGGLHYSFSTAAGLRLGRQVANYDLHQLFDVPQQP
jgi:hypothetical protein